MKKATEVFIYSAPEDESMLLELLKHLQVFQQRKIITIWHNSTILAGVDREKETEVHFNQAEYILLLISPDFMNVHYGYNLNVQRALERHHQGEVVVIPVILRPVHWQETPFGKLQALPRGAVPITSEKWHHPDNAFYNVIEGLKPVLEKEASAGTHSLVPSSIVLKQDQPSSKHARTFPAAFSWRYWGMFCVLQKTKTSCMTLNKVARMGQRLLPIFTRNVILRCIPVVTTTLLFMLLLLLLVRPGWCPSSLCLPTLAPIATYPGGVYDTNIDAYLVKLQSTSFDLPGDTHKYTLQKLPSSIAAVRSDNNLASPYRLVIGVINLHSKGYGIYIEHVELVVIAVPPLANPLNVWNTSSLTYNTNPYFVTYKGEPAGSILDAGYEPVPNLIGVHQLLGAGEMGNIDLQINPEHNLQADLLFQVRIIYRMSNEKQEHPLTLSKSFEVVFSTASNWHVHTF